MRDAKLQNSFNSMDATDTKDQIYEKDEISDSVMTRSVAPVEFASNVGCNEDQ